MWPGGSRADGRQSTVVQASEDVGLALAKGLMHCVALRKSLLLSDSTFPHEANGLESMILEILVS